MGTDIDKAVRELAERHACKFFGVEHVWPHEENTTHSAGHDEPLLMANAIEAAIREGAALLAKPLVEALAVIERKGDDPCSMRYTARTALCDFEAATKVKP